MEKYKELYDLAIAVHNEEINRFNRLDQKASRYLSVFSILIAVLVGMSKWLIETFIPIATFFDAVILIMFFILGLIFIVGWYYSFAVLKNHNLAKIPINREIIDFYNNNTLINIYFTMSKSVKNANFVNSTINDSKSKSLGRSYYSILIGIFSLIVLFLLIFVSITKSKMSNNIEDKILWQNKKIKILMKSPKPNNL